MWEHRRQLLRLVWGHDCVFMCLVGYADFEVLIDHPIGHSVTDAYSWHSIFRKGGCRVKPGFYSNDKAYNSHSLVER